MLSMLSKALLVCQLALLGSAYNLKSSSQAAVGRRAWVGGAAAWVGSAAGAVAIGDVDRWQPDSNRVCVRRAALGACAVYADAPSDDAEESAPPVASERQAKEIAAIREAEDSNAFITKLRAKTEQNRAVNEQTVAMKSFENSQSGEFGPFSKFLPVRKFDGTYELMTYDMYNQKEKLGEVKNRKYIIDIDALIAAKKAKDEATAASAGQSKGN